MKTAIVVSSEFDSIWPFTADRIHQLLEPVAEVRSPARPRSRGCSVADAVADPATVCSV